jgi:hypothetical protein
MAVNDLWNVAGFIGAITVASGLSVAVYALVVWIGEKLRELRFHHAYKHRFDKPPLAKCYCKDCRWHMKNNRCDAGSEKYTPDNGFCYEAEPMTMKEARTDGKTD